MSQNEPPDFDGVHWHIDDDHTYTWQEVTSPNVITPNIPNITIPNVMDFVPYMPPELMVCVVCGVDDVLIFCDACKEVIREARRQWARDFLEEIEDALS